MSRRLPNVTPLSEVLAPEERLRRSLRLLERALADQAAAVSSLRNAHVELGGIVRNIEMSLQKYQIGLVDIKTANDALAKHARDLRSWCERYDFSIKDQKTIPGA